VVFFALGALLFGAHRLMAGDPRTISVTPAIRADLSRRFRDHERRPPTPAELESAVAAWKRDEALYREALREQLDREDATVRTVLADKMRARMALVLPKRTPTDAELARWLDTHRALYETPRRYDYESIAFTESEASLARELARFSTALAAGADPASLGRPVVGGTLAADELRARVGASAAERIPSLPLGRWERVDGEGRVLLLRVRRVVGGLPALEELRPRLLSDFTYAAEQQAIERETQRIVERYRFEEEP
jgi:hypothetical protein